MNNECTSHVSLTGHDKVYCEKQIGHKGNHETTDLQWTKRAPIKITVKAAR